MNNAEWNTHSAYSYLANHFRSSLRLIQAILDLADRMPRPSSDRNIDPWGVLFLQGHDRTPKFRHIRFVPISSIACNPAGFMSKKIYLAQIIFTIRPKISFLSIIK